MSVRIRRAFVCHGGTCLHYRYAGQGPVLVLLHQSPQNSRMWLAEMAWLARDHLVLAPDLPGFGQSDPLPLAQPTIGDLSAACHDWLDALGVAHCAVFGMHTGGIVAVHMGLDRPDRVGLVLVDGYAIFTEAERARLGEAYLPPFRPDWSGQHLRWLWARMREQRYFFPWCEQDAAAALRYSAADTAQTEAAVMDILEVGDAYRLGYRAALQFAARGCVAELGMPTQLFYREDDVLIEHYHRLPPLAEPVQASRLPDRAALWRALTAALAAWRPVAIRHPEPHPGRSTALAAKVWQREVFDLAEGELVAWVWRPLAPISTIKLVLHAPAEAPQRPPDCVTGPGWLEIRPDLPGHGASTWLGAEPLQLASLAAILVDWCRTAAPDAALSIEAHAGAAALALTVADAWPGRIEGLSLIQPWLLEPHERDWLLAHLPDLRPQAAGGHLLEAWQWERERHLFPPWQAPLGAHRLPGAAPAVERVQANTVCLLGLGARLRELLQALLPLDLSLRLRRSPHPIHVQFDPTRDDGRLALLARERQTADDPPPGDALA